MTPPVRPAVSVVTPVHNAERFLRETLDALLAQSFGDWEALLVDDGSVDGSAAILAEYATRDPRFRPLSAGSNLGAARARNLAIEAARGRYLAFCDSDDVWTPDKLAVQLAFMDETGAPLSFTSYDRVDETGRLKGVVRAVDRVAYADMLKTCVIGFSTAVMDLEQTGKVFLPGIKRRNDYALWLEVLRRGHVARGLDRSTMRYRVRADSLSGNKLKAAAYQWHVLRKVEGLSLPAAATNFIHYAVQATRRRM